MIAVALLLASAGCGSDGNKTIIEDGIPVDVDLSSAAVDSGNSIEVSAEASASSGPFTFSWTAAAGRFSDPSAQTTTWTAPDEDGVFSLTCVVADGANSGLGSADVIVDLYVPTDTPAYNGATRCSGCHSVAGQPGGDQYNPWLDSPHADAFEALRRAGREESSFCHGCHTVGSTGLFADPDLDNGAYNDTNVARLEAVQCENCHGPGSRHPNPDFNSVAISLESDNCGNCHNFHLPTFDEWQTSLHSMPIDSPALRRNCAKCHNGLEGPRFLNDPEGYVDLPENPTEVLAHTCANCHEPHGTENPGQLRDASVTDRALPNAILQPNGGAGRLCMACHNGRRTEEDVNDQIDNGGSIGPHGSVQGDMISGVNAYEVLAPGFPFTSSQHILVEDACVTCHTAPNAGDPEFDIPPSTGHTFEPTVEACQRCHGDIDDFDDIQAKADYDGNGLIEGNQTEVLGLLDLLMQTIIDASATEQARQAFLDDFLGTLGDASLSTREQRESGYNWTYVDFDGSSGVHNVVYSVQLLQQSILYLDPGALDATAVLTEGN